MKKLHGTHSIQPLTITDAVVADEAAIQEHKLLLDVCYKTPTYGGTPSVT